MKTFSILHFAALMILILPMSNRAADKKRGAQLYKNCAACHGARGIGNKTMLAPLIGGQFDWYIVSQLKAFKEKKRQSPQMGPFVQSLSEQDMKDLGAYIQTLR